MVCRLDRANRPNTEVLINQVKQEDAEITSPRSAEVKPRFIRNIKPLHARVSTSEIIASAEITAIRKDKR